MEELTMSSFAPLPACKVCDRGYLQQKRVYRMSSPVVFIGFVFLIPSVIGMLFCALLMVAAINQGKNNDVLVVFIVMGIACFVSGIFGWLLVMKKSVLQCATCNATVNAG
jgi:hypothetical protein